ncbi:MAG: DUF3429 domain-containing protein [Rhodospirillaceae bacterium]|nr:DUF3429 domain-containing protein [Rhodospirillaceae bacterium]
MKDVPKPFLVLGLAAIVPIWALGLAALLVAEADWAWVFLQFQTVFAAVLCSALGAVHWGLVLAGQARRPGPLDGRAKGMLVYGLIPALLGWLVVVGVPFFGQWWMWPLLMIALVSGTYLADIQARDAGLLPDWYLALRKIVTIGAQTGLAISLGATL